MTGPRVNLTIPSPAPFLNANHRHHWARKARDTKAWRTAAWAQARSERLAPRQSRAHVIVVFHRERRRHADVGNLAPTAKAIVDGMAEGKTTITPDPMSSQLYGFLLKDYESAEKELGAVLPGA